MPFLRNCRCAAVLTLALTVSAMGKPNWKHRYAEVNGVRLHYVEQGKGPLIVFLHGFPEFWYEWRRLLPDFARDHRAVAPDMRGYNLSGKPEGLEAYRIPAIVEDIRQLAQRLKARKFVLAGHDWGGVIAWAFAGTHPEMLSHLVIINAPHPAVFARELAANPLQQKASAYFNLFASPQAEATLSGDGYQRLTAVFGNTLSDEERKAYIEAWSRPGALTGGLNYYRAAQLRSPVDGAKPEPSAARQSVAPMPLLNMPVLVVWGEKDTALLAGNLNGLEQHVSNLQVKRIPEGSHWVIHEQPETVIRLMREFIERR